MFILPKNKDNCDWFSNGGRFDFKGDNRIVGCSQIPYDMGRRFIRFNFGLFKQNYEYRDFRKDVK
ncbi:unnamed protein product [marine sediment metagenome]|uniref:Uncharacterized protein n=1 Tax=marine sediment metagenome TaxID=412755 RepID=X1AYL1_9ZZZZ